MKYQFVKEHPHTFEIKHPDGSHFHVAKSGIHPGFLPKIKGLPTLGMADGGEVPDDSEDSGDQEGSKEQASAEGEKPQDQASPKALDVSPVSEQEIEDSSPLVQESLPNKEQMPAPKVFGPSGQPAQRGIASPADIMSQQQAIFQKEAQGIQGAAAAQSEGAKEQSAIYDANQKQLQDVQSQYQARLSQLDAENKQLSQDVVNAKIDPHRVWNSASTGNKIVAGIGMLLSGIGSGLTGRPNMAMEVINNSINRDIEAQKADLGKKENLLSINYRKYGELNAATQATMLQMNAITQGQIASAAAKSNSKSVTANAQVAIGQLENQALQLKSQLAQQQFAYGAIGGNGGQNPFAYEALNKTFPNRVVQLPNGQYGVAQSPKDAEHLRDTQAGLSSVDKQLDEMLQFMNKTGTTYPGSSNNAVANNLRNGVITELNKLNDLKRLNEYEFKTFSDMVPSPGAFFQDRARAQLMELKRRLREKLNSDYASRLTNYNPDRFRGQESAPKLGG